MVLFDVVETQFSLATFPGYAIVPDHVEIILVIAWQAGFEVWLMVTQRMRTLCLCFAKCDHYNWTLPCSLPGSEIAQHLIVFHWVVLTTACFIRFSKLGTFEKGVEIPIAVGYNQSRRNEGEMLKSHKCHAHSAWLWWGSEVPSERPQQKEQLVTVVTLLQRTILQERCQTLGEAFNYPSSVTIQHRAKKENTPLKKWGLRFGEILWDHSTPVLKLSPFQAISPTCVPYSWLSRQTLAKETPIMGEEGKRKGKWKIWEVKGGG